MQLISHQKILNISRLCLVSLIRVVHSCPALQCHSKCLFLRLSRFATLLDLTVTMFCLLDGCSAVVGTCSCNAGRSSCSYSCSYLNRKVLFPSTVHRLVQEQARLLYEALAAGHTTTPFQLSALCFQALASCICSVCSGTRSLPGWMLVLACLRDDLSRAPRDTFVAWTASQARRLAPGRTGLAVCVVYASVCWALRLWLSRDLWLDDASRWRSAKCVVYVEALEWSLGFLTCCLTVIPLTLQRVQEKFVCQDKRETINNTITIKHLAWGVTVVINVVKDFHAQKISNSKYFRISEWRELSNAFFFSDFAWIAVTARVVNIAHKI